MNKTFSLLATAITVNLVTLILINLGDAGTGSDLQYYDSINTVVWLVAIALAIVIAIVYRKELFKKRVIALTIPLLICCTPLPLAGFYWINHSTTETGLIDAKLNSSSGRTYKIEHWEYILTSKLYVDKLYVIDTPDVNDVNDSRFKRHGKWIYLKPSGDTLKIETYSNGKLNKVIPKQ